MENEEKDDIITSENNDEEETSEDEETSQEETSEEGTEKVSEKPKETPEAKKARLERQLKRVNKELGIEEKKEVPKKKETPKNESYSLQDIRALNDVHDDDVEEVVDYAKRKGISIAEAKKTSIIQSFLKDSEEKRKTAQATNTGGGRRGASTMNAEKLIANKAKGLYPGDDDGIQKLVKAEFDEKKRIIEKRRRT